LHIGVVNITRPALIIFYELRPVGIAYAPGKLLELNWVRGQVVLRAIVDNAKAVLESPQKTVAFDQQLAVLYACESKLRGCS
jgi:hypothetical protein